MISDTIDCPYCGYKFTDYDMDVADEDLYALAQNECQTNLDCPRCEKKFNVQGGYNPTYETEKI
jgi:DNA-directed RNA polymerase subunit RPC12/RpoP